MNYSNSDLENNEGDTKSFKEKLKNVISTIIGFLIFVAFVCAIVQWVQNKNAENEFCQQIYSLAREELNSNLKSYNNVEISKYKKANINLQEWDYHDFGRGRLRYARYAVTFHCEYDTVTGHETLDPTLNVYYYTSNQEVSNGIDQSVPDHFYTPDMYAGSEDLLDWGNYTENNATDSQSFMDANPQIYETIQEISTEDNNSLKKNCQRLDLEYNDIIRNEEDMRGKDYFLDVHIFENEDSEGLLQAYYKLLNVVWLFDARKDSSLQILSGDDVIVYVRFIGTVSVEEFTGTSVIPVFAMFDCEIDSTDTEVTNVESNDTTSGEAIVPSDLSGYYMGSFGQSVGDISIYSSMDESYCGNATMYLDSEIENYGGTELKGELLQTDEDTYLLEAEDCDWSVYLITKYSSEYDSIMIEMWINDELVEEYFMMEHYTS